MTSPNTAMTRTDSAIRNAAAAQPVMFSEAELDDVAVAHHVVLALNARLARGPRRGDRASRHEVIEGHDLGLDEAALKIGVDDAGGLGGGGPGRDRPGPGLLRAGGQERRELERGKAGPGELSEPWLSQAHLGQQLRRLRARGAGQLR